MAWPYDSLDYFDHGDIATPGGPWTSKTDDDSKITLQHFSDMPGSVTPFMGSYSLKIDLESSTTEAYLVDTATIADAVTGHVAFAMYLPSNFVDSSPVASFNILEAIDTSAGDASTAGLKSLADGTWVADCTHNATAGTDGTIPFDFDTWYWIEIEISMIVAAGGGTTTLFARKIGEAARTQMAQATGSGAEVAVATLRFGAQGISATGIENSFYLDHYHSHTTTTPAAIGPPRVIFDEDIPFAAPRQLFVGPGKLKNITLLAGSTTADNELYVYDTDTAQVTDDKIVAVLKNTAVLETVDVANTPIHVQRGAYVVIKTDADGDTYNPEAKEPRGIANVSPRYYGSRDLIRRLRGMR